MKQLSLFEPNELESSDLTALSPSEIWSRLDQRIIPMLVEDERVEFKKVEIRKDKYVTYLSMWSNTQPEGGLILVGVDDDGLCVGVPNNRISYVNDLQSIHVQCCPEARPEYKRIPIDKEGERSFVLAAYVPYRGELVRTNKQEAYIRYGSSIHKMSSAEADDFRASRGETKFELQDIKLNWPQDFDQTIINSICSNYRSREDLLERTNEDVLCLRHLGRFTRNGEFIPNKALALLASTNVRLHFPGCRIRLLKFEGNEEGHGASFNPVLDRFIEGNVVQLIERTATLLDNVIRDFTYLGQEGRFVRTKEYPKEAWLEAIVNAVSHRSYVFANTDSTIKIFEDRMEIESPGGFVPPVTPETIYTVRASRNPFLMDALYLLDYVRLAREGTRRMKASMQEFDLPEPEFKQEALNGIVVKVVLKNNSEYRRRAGDTGVINFFGVTVWQKLSDDEKKIAEVALQNGDINVSEASRAISTTWTTARKVLAKMVEAGLMVHIHDKSSRDNKAHFILSDGTQVKNETQSEKFIEVARQAGCDESGKGFESALKTIAAQKPKDEKQK